MSLYLPRLTLSGCISLVFRKYITIVIYFYPMVSYPSDTSVLTIVYDYLLR